MEEPQKVREGLPGPSRREFLKDAGWALVAAHLADMARRTARAQTSEEVLIERIRFAGQGVTLGGYLCRPKTDSKYPGIVVIHENQGLTDYIQGVAQDLAKAGYVALAVNLTSRKLGPEAAGGTAEAAAALRELSTEDAVKDLGSGVDHLKQQAFVDPERIGCVGFCYGGRLSLLLAANRKDVGASVVFYGRPQDALSLIPDLKAAVLASYGEQDGSIPVAQVKQLEDALKQNNKVYDIKIYPGAGHAFHRPGGSSYNADAARDAWARTLTWFEKYLTKAAPGRGTAARPPDFNGDGKVDFDDFFLFA
jgi:carboxymethylenebutenolidase